MLETLLLSAVVNVSGVAQVAATIPARPGTLPAAAMVSDPKHRTIVHIVSRDQTITVKSGERGLLYSLTGTDGKLIVADATPQKFAELQPELYRQVRTFVAAKTDESSVVATAGD